MDAKRPSCPSPTATWRAAACTFTSACRTPQGRNIFAAANPLDSTPLRHAIGGTLATLADGMAVCAPGPNSYRRFRSEAYVPLHPTWSINNRGSAIRVPASDPDNLRIEHRLAGRRCESLPRARLGPRRHSAWPRTQSSNRRPCSTGNAYVQEGDPLPIALGRGHRAFRRERIRDARRSARSSRISSPR